MPWIHYITVGGRRDVNQRTALSFIAYLMRGWGGVSCGCIWRYKRDKIAESGAHEAFQQPTVRLTVSLSLHTPRMAVFPFYSLCQNSACVKSAHDLIVYCKPAKNLALACIWSSIAVCFSPVTRLVQHCPPFAPLRQQPQPQKKPVFESS